MNAVDMIVNFFKQGGAFLYPIAAVFAVGLGFAVERFIYLRRVAKGNRRLWAELAPLIEAGNFSRTMEVAGRTDSALSTFKWIGQFPPIKENTMSAVLTHKRHHVPLSFLFGVLLALVLIMVLAVVLSSIAFPGTTSRPSADRSYDVIEQVRVQRANAYAIEAFDYDHIESIRVQRSVIPLLISDGYVAVEEVRVQRALDHNADRSYDSIEALRLDR